MVFILCISIVLVIVCDIYNTHLIIIILYILTIYYILCAGSTVYSISFRFSIFGLDSVVKVKHLQYSSIILK